MLSNPRSRGTARLAAGSVLAATALASGAFAALGVTAAHADGTPGTYVNATPSSWAAGGSTDATTTSVNVPDQIQALSSVSLTLHNFTDGDVTGLHLYLVDPNGNITMLEFDPTGIAGGPAVSGQDITFSSDGTGEQGNVGSLSQEVGQLGTGEWDLGISDDKGTAGSIDGWTLNIAEAPIVTAQPEDVSGNSGDNASFVAAAEGVPTPTVQWQSSTDGGDSWTPIEGATSPTYTITGMTTAQNNNVYRAVFTNAAGSASSELGNLFVNGTTPTVTSQPVDVNELAGNPASFTAAASGDPAVTGVQWEKSTDNGTTWSWIDGANSNTYTLDHPVTLDDSGTMFHAIFSNSEGDTTTAPAKLTVTGSVPSAPRNVTASQTGPGAVTIHWAPSVDGGSPAMTGYEPGWGTGQMGNGEHVAASATSDTFKSLAPGNYTFSVAAINPAGQSTRVSVPVKVVAPTTTPKAAVSAKRVIAGGKFVLSGTGLKNSTVTIQQLKGKSFVKVAKVKTNSWGAYSVKIPVIHTSTYRVVSPNGKVSSKVTVTAPYAVHVQTVRTAARAYTIKGWITPVAARRTVHVTATVAGKLVKIATLSTSNKGQYTTHYKFAKTGPVTLHITVSSGAQNAAGSLNKALTVS